MRYFMTFSFVTLTKWLPLCISCHEGEGRAEAAKCEGTWQMLTETFISLSPLVLSNPDEKYLRSPNMLVFLFTVSEFQVHLGD